MLVTHTISKSYIPAHSNPQPSFKLFKFSISSFLPSHLWNTCPTLIVVFFVVVFCLFFSEPTQRASVGKPGSQFLQDYFISPQQYNATLKWPEPASSDASCLHHPSDINTSAASYTCCPCSLWILVSRWKRASSAAGRAVKGMRNSSLLPFIPTANVINAPVMLRQTWLQSGVSGSLCPIWAWFG